MSRLASKLCWLVLLGLIVSGCNGLISVNDQPPADDPWFQATVVDRVEPVLVKFGANWCGPCRRLDPELDRLESDLGGLVSVVRVDVDRHRDLAQHYGVSSIPRILLIHHGQVIADRTGYSDHHELQQWIVAQADNL